MSVTAPRFSELPYVRIDLTAHGDAYAALLSSLDASTTPERTIELIREWFELRKHYSTMASLAEVHYSQNVADQASKAEKEFYDHAQPVVSEWLTNVSKKVLTSPHRAQISAELGELFLIKLEQMDRTFSPAIKDLMLQESELSNKYNEITASAKIDVDGKAYNLSTLAKLTSSTDREIRKRAIVAQYEFLGRHAHEVDDIYDKLTKLRTEKAKRLNFPSYTEYRYVEFGRVGYGPEEVAVFRQQVVDHVVPLVNLFRTAQAKRLGIDNVRGYDEKLQFPDGNPVAQGDHDWIVGNATRMYSELSPETKEFFDLMIERDLLDLKSRDNKAVGGYCTSFPGFGLPFIFANFNQTTHDVEVLTHEAGHAFQAYRSRHFDVPDYWWPTSEACEVHSMGMEFLTWPWMGLFFGEQLERFKFYHLQGALLFLPYGCAVDHFQHWNYAHPDATPADRLAAWKDMERIYLPWRDASDIPGADEGRQWQFQRHIYESPFYYIDYALAQTCALQYWQWSQKDAKAAFESYLKICDIGGSQSFVEIVESGGLKSPFKAGTLESIVADAYAWLKAEFPELL
jgi:M3 family oligoendopeptidase